LDSKINAATAQIEVSVLMYHSISNSSGPTSIPVETFRAQIKTLRECGYRTVSLADFTAWLSAEKRLEGRSVVITFDDGFADFADSAFPILRDHNFTAAVFVPSGKIGQAEDWEGTNTAEARRLMNWAQVADLASQGIEFGGHSVSHTDLTRLSMTDLHHEVRRCRDELEQHTARPVIAFAPPFGRAHIREREEIRKWFAVSFGTQLERARPGCDQFDVPRIEMHYFRDVKRWRDFLQGRGAVYFTARRALRGLKQAIAGV